jgi:quercetin dioxygenase-like cupin family protein
MPAKLSIGRLFARANDLSRTSLSATPAAWRIPLLSQREELDMTETLDVLGAPMTVQRDAGLFLAEQPIPPGYFVPPHRHADDEEMLCVMEGELTLIDETGESRAAAGACLHFERGQLHGFRNDSGGTVKLLVIAKPGVQTAEMFRHFDRAAKAGPLAPPDVVAIAAEYGVSFG